MKVIKWFVIIGIVVFLANKYYFREPSDGLAIDFDPETDLVGLFEVDDPGIISGRLGLRFLGANQVEMLADRTKLGDTVYYSVDGNDITITHACGVWHLEARESGLYHKDQKRYFVATEE